MNIYCRHFNYGSAIGCLRKVATRHFSVCFFQKFLLGTILALNSNQRKGRENRPTALPTTYWISRCLSGTLLASEMVLQVWFHSPPGWFIVSGSSCWDLPNLENFPTLFSKDLFFSSLFVCFLLPNLEQSHNKAAGFMWNPFSSSKEIKTCMPSGYFFNLFIYFLIKAFLTSQNFIQLQSIPRIKMKKTRQWRESRVSFCLHWVLLSFTHKLLASTFPNFKIHRRLPRNRTSSSLQPTCTAGWHQSETGFHLPANTLACFVAPSTYGQRTSGLVDLSKALLTFVYSI